MKFVRTEEMSSSKMAEGMQIAEIISAVEKTSQKGNPMLVLKIKNATGSCTTRLPIMDSMMWKVLDALAAIGRPVGIGEEFEVDPADFVGETVSVEIKNNDDGWPDVDKWLPRTQPAGKKAASTALEADEIPF